MIFWKLGLLITALALSKLAMAESYLYKANCDGSYSKQDSLEHDLSSRDKIPIRCSAAILSRLNNGNTLIQLALQDGSGAMGFAGSSFDYEANPNFITVPLERIHLPNTSNPSKSHTFQVADGFCFIDGNANIRKLASIACSAKVEVGNQKFTYSIRIRIDSTGNIVPRM